MEYEKWNAIEISHFVRNGGVSLGFGEGNGGFAANSPPFMTQVYRHFDQQEKYQPCVHLVLQFGNLKILTEIRSRRTKFSLMYNNLSLELKEI